MNTKLLIPDLVSTTLAVKEEMLETRCNWDIEHKVMTQRIRKQLLELSQASNTFYTTILMQGSGTIIVESVLTTVVSQNDKLLIISNGADGDKMVCIAHYLRLDYLVYKIDYDEVPNWQKIQTILEANSDITHIAIVHCETTTGILNPIKKLAKIGKKHGKIVIVDATSTFGGITIPVEEYQIDYVIGSAYKCLQGVPGIGFVIAKKDDLHHCESNARSLSLDLYDQWKVMNRDGSWRFTSPTHTVAAFSRAIDELLEEGGILARYERYKRNNDLLRRRLSELGFHAYIDEELQSPIVTTFLFPHSNFSFEHFQQFIKERGYTISPGILANVNTFRIGNIGHIDETDIRALCNIIEEFTEVVVV